MANRRPIVLGADGLLQQLQAADLLDAAARVAYDDANTGLGATQVQSAIDALNAIVAQGGNATSQGTWLVSGGGVAWVSGYVFNVAPAQYYIAGIAHTSPAAQKTLAAADPTFNRFDIVAVDSTGAVVVLQGTPASAPELPDVDPQTQLALTIVRVDTGTSAPPAVVSSTIYAENLGTPTEWTGTASAASITLGSTSNPHAGTKDVEGTAVANGTYFEFQAAAALDVTAKTSLVFYLRSKAAWPKTKSLQISWRNGTAPVGSAVALSDGFFGWNSATLGSYQTVVIPIAQFNLAAGTLADRVRFLVSGGGSSVGFYFDDCALQGGVTSQAPGITQQQADARYAQRAANLSDLTSALTAQTNLGLRGRLVVADAATVTFDRALGRRQQVTLGGNRAFAFAGFVDGDDMEIYVGQDATGTRVPVWPTVRWAGGVAPTHTTTANKVDTVVIERVGTEYFGYLAGANI